MRSLVGTHLVEIRELYTFNEVFSAMVSHIYGQIQVVFHNGSQNSEQQPGQPAPRG